MKKFLNIFVLMLICASSLFSMKSPSSDISNFSLLSVSSSDSSSTNNGFFVSYFDEYSEQILINTYDKKFKSTLDETLGLIRSMFEDLDKDLGDISFLHNLDLLLCLCRANKFSENDQDLNVNKAIDTLIDLIACCAMCYTKYGKKSIDEISECVCCMLSSELKDKSIDFHVTKIDLLSI
jgi:hypothetical protein